MSKSARKFTVLSERIGLPVGSTIDESALADCNADALIAGGHIEPVTPGHTKESA